MLGNDVVDLLDVDARPETFHRRFDQRVFTEDERRAITEDPSPHALRWAHWAAKEAAYKCLRQGDPRFVFSPIRLEVRFEPAETAEPGAGGAAGAVSVRRRRGVIRVVPGDGSTAGAHALSSATELELRACETADWVHVVARPLGRDWSDVALAVEPLAASGEEASLAVRRLARREIARALAVDPARVTIGRRDRIPTLELDDAPLPIALSLSHHGRFVACAMAPCRSARDGDERSATKRVLTVGSVGSLACDRGAKRRTG